MNATVSEIIGLMAMGFIVAGVSVVIVNGGKTARIINEIGKTYVNAIKAAKG